MIVFLIIFISFWFQQENDFALYKDEEMYDPRFLLLLFSCILRPGKNNNKTLNQSVHGWWTDHQTPLD